MPAATAEEAIAMGAVAPSGLCVELPTLTYTTAKGVARYWKVAVSLAQPGTGAPDTWAAVAIPPGKDTPHGAAAVLRVFTGRAGAEPMASVPVVYAGVANRRGPYEQALREALSRWRKHGRVSVGTVSSPASPASPASSASPAATATAATATAAPAADDDDAEGPEDAGEAGEADAVDDASSASSAAHAAGSADDAGSAGSAGDTIPPMLVKKLGDTRAATLTADDYRRGVIVQPKLNGVRYVAHLRKGASPARGADIRRYSRGRLDYPGVEPVADELAAMMRAAYADPRACAAAVAAGAPASPASAASASWRPPAAVYLDGELWLPGASLNWISGQARGADGGDLQFHVFDAFVPAALGTPARARAAYVEAFFAAADAAGVAHPHVCRVPSAPVGSDAELEAAVQRYLAAGLEGGIARRAERGYEPGQGGYHSDALLKVKPTFDAEYPVVGFTTGARGRDEGAVIFVCEAPARAGGAAPTFRVVPSLPLESRRRLAACLSEVVTAPSGARVTRFERDLRGAPLTVKYAELSAKTGVPLQPKGVVFRTYEDGAARDPFAALMRECSA